MLNVRIVRLAFAMLGWLLFLVSLRAPGDQGDPGDLIRPLPVFLMLVILFFVPQFFLGWIATACFLLSPFLLAGHPRGWIGVIRHSACATLLIVWVLPALEVLAPVISFRSPPHLMWGYYLLAAGFTCVWIATVLDPDSSRIPSRQRGFPVTNAHEESLSSAPPALDNGSTRHERDQ